MQHHVNFSDVIMMADKARSNISNHTFKCKILIEFDTMSIDGIEKHKLEYNF